MQTCYNKIMLEIFYTQQPVRSEEYIRFVLRKYYNIPNPTICKSIHGKPYIPGDKICFNLSHSKGLTALAAGKKGSVGFDCESLSGKARPAVLSRFTERERQEIGGTQDFYAHWTARESYVKYLGGSLAALWRHIEFFGGKLYVDGAETGVRVTQFDRGGYAFSFCGNYAKYSFRRADPPAKA